MQMYGNFCLFFVFIVDVSYFYQGGKFPFILKKYMFSQRKKKHNVIFILVVVESCNKLLTESVQIISRNSIILCLLPAVVKIIMGWSNGTSKTMQKSHVVPFPFQWGQFLLPLSLWFWGICYLGQLSRKVY